MRWMLGRVVAFVAIVFLGFTFGPAARTQTPPPPEVASALPGTGWLLKIHRTDDGAFASEQQRDEAWPIQFLPSGSALVQRNSALFLTSWKAKGNGLTVEGEGFSASFGFANGPTSGKGTMNLLSFNVTGLEYQGVIDLNAPLYQSAIKNDTCTFASRTLQTALHLFWALPEYGVPYQMQGQSQARRYDNVLVASVKGKSKSFKGVKAEYERRVAELSACVVTIDERPYGLEMLNEREPVDDEAIQVDTMFRLRGAPEYLSDLRIQVNGYWSMSPWTSVTAGVMYGNGEGPTHDLFEAEYRLTKKRNLQWTPVSTAPAMPDPLAGWSIRDLEKKGKELYDLADGPRKHDANFRGQAMRYYHAACERGSMVACGRKGSILAKYSLGVDNAKRAGPLFEKGCTANDAESCYGFTRYLRERWPESARDPARANAMVEKLCEESYGPACGEQAGRTIKDKKDLRGGVALYARACALQDEFSCQTGALIFYAGVEGVPQDLAKARSMFTNACGSSNFLISKSCRYAGVMYLQGQGGDKSEDMAKLMFARGCDFLDEDSCKVLNRPLPAKVK